jgi:integrase
MMGLEIPERSEHGTTRPVTIPTGQDIGRIVTWINRSRVHDRDRLAAMLMLYTGQRRQYVASARQDEFREVEAGGLTVWIVPQPHRKTVVRSAQRRVPKSHVIPLPPQALAYVDLAKDRAVGSEWLFPALRARDSETQATHMHADNLTHLFDLIEWPPNEDGTKRDPTPTPHDVRRAFATTFKDLKELTDLDVKRILDHTEGRAPGDVTRGHYDFAEEVGLKFPVIEAWCNWVDMWAERMEAVMDAEEREKAEKEAAKKAKLADAAE